MINTIKKRRRFILSEWMGMEFGRLTIIGDVGMRSGGRYVLCQCSCGNAKEVKVVHLGKGIESCGCLRSQVLTKHGMSKAPEYDIYIAMHQRCYNPKCKAYKNYGQAGIRVCDRWHSFENFIADMGSRPSKKLTLERKTSKGDYCPDNCIWADRLTQNNNTSRNRKFTVGGEYLSVSQLARSHGLNVDTVFGRLRDNGGDIIKALVPLKTTNQK